MAFFFVGLGLAGTDRRAYRAASICRSAAAPSLADFVESSLAKSFEPKDIGRVLVSWDDAKRGNVLQQLMDDGSILQRAEYFVTGLTPKPWHEVAEYDWAGRLEEDCAVIKGELEKSMRSAALEKRGNNVWVTAVREEAMAYGPDWRTLVLQDRGIWEPKNSKIFRETVKVLKKHNVPCSEVFFAKQPPGTGIKPHTDNSNFTLTAHLALDVPKDKSWIKVGGEQRYWEDGKLLIFDTSYTHETWNDGDTDRYVLLVRFWHPELTRKEIRALEHIFRAVEEYNQLF